MRKDETYYSFSGYRYAPEQFKAYKVTGFSHGNRNIPEYERLALTDEQKSACGLALCTGGKEQAAAKLRAAMRENAKRPTVYYTVGFVCANNPRQYVYIEDNRTWNQYDQRALNQAYKDLRAHMDYKGWKLERFTTAKLDGAGTVTETTTDYDEVDRHKPCIVRLVVPEQNRRPGPPEGGPEKGA